MIETKRGQDYNVFNRSLNKDSNDWLTVPNKLVKNAHNMLEIQLDLENAVLLGSSNSVNLTTEVINRYRVTYDFLQ